MNLPKPTCEMAKAVCEALKPGRLVVVNDGESRNNAVVVVLNRSADDDIPALRVWMAGCPANMPADEYWTHYSDISMDPEQVLLVFTSEYWGPEGLSQDKVNDLAYMRSNFNVVYDQADYVTLGERLSLSLSGDDLKIVLGGAGDLPGDVMSTVIDAYGNGSINKVDVMLVFNELMELNKKGKKNGND